MKPMKMPDWFDPKLQELFDKKRDRSKIHPFNRSLDGLLRAALKMVPSEITGISTHKHTWDDVESLIEEACISVELSGYKADAVVGIKSGGAFIANYVASCLNIPLVGYMKTVHYSEKSRSVVLSVVHTAEEAKVKEEPKKALVHKRNILLVDDQIGGGSSIKVAKLCIEKLGSKNVKKLCLYSPDLNKADYCPRRGMAVYFPWGKDA